MAGVLRGRLLACLAWTLLAAVCVLRASAATPLAVGAMATDTLIAGTTNTVAFVVTPTSAPATVRRDPSRPCGARTHADGHRTARGV